MTQTLKNFLLKLVNDYQSYKAFTATVKELRALTDKELNDIGINRGDIYSIARMDIDMKKSEDVYANPNLRGFV